MISSLIKKVLRQRFLYYNRNHRLRTDLKNIDVKNLPPLLKSEKEEILAVWGQITPEINFKQHQFFKMFHGQIDPNYLTDDVYVPYVERTLNSYLDMQYAQNKATYPLLYKELKQPKCYINSVNNNVFFCGVKASLADAIENLLDLNLERVIIKQGKDSYGGFGVKIIDLDNSRQENSKILNELLLKFQKNDFVVQEIIRQSKHTSFLNPASLNTIRATSLNINNRTSVETYCFKSGLNGSIVDNLASGGVLVGIDSNQRLNNYALTSHNEKIFSSDELCFGGKVIPSINKINDIINKYHSLYFPNFGIIGWDFAIDENNEPVFIEANLWYPGVFGEQIAYNASIFQSRTQEVIDYVKENKKYVSYIQF